jgi:ribosomal protein S18 acetylase RimI-like enzyme
MQPRTPDRDSLPNNPTVGLAGAEDLMAIADCMQPVYTDTYPNERGIKKEMFDNDTFRGHLEEYLQERLLDPNTRIWVAREGSKIIGTIGLEISPDDQTAEVWGFYVLPSSQEQGVGTSLWEALMSSNELTMLKKLKLVVAKDSKKAIEYYQNRGFSITGEQDRNWPSWTEEKLVNQYWDMEKTLS